MHRNIRQLSLTGVFSLDHKEDAVPALGWDSGAVFGWRWWWWGWKRHGGGLGLGHGGQERLSGKGEVTVGPLLK